MTEEMEIVKLETEIATLRARITELVADNAGLRAMVNQRGEEEERDAVRNELVAETVRLRDRVAELEGRSRARWPDETERRIGDEISEQWIRDRLSGVLNGLRTRPGNVILRDFEKALHALLSARHAAGEARRDALEEAAGIAESYGPPWLKSPLGGVIAGVIRDRMDLLGDPPEKEQPRP